MKDDPARSTRNLIDLGMNCAKGRFQRRFFSEAQEMLQNENSAYYPMVQDIVTHVDNERLLTFGMNVGYNSCTIGAKTIRQIEAEQRFDIPWVLTLAPDGWSSEQLDSAVSQGEAIGIRTWQLFPGKSLFTVLSVITSHSDSAFILFLKPEAVTRQLISEAAELPNMMIAVQYSEETGEVCDRMRHEGLLYSVYFAYQTGDLPTILSGELFDASDEFHPVFTAVLPGPECPEMLYARVYEAVNKARHSQNYRTIPWDLLGDNCTVDGIISEHTCTAGFDRNGCLVRAFERITEPEYNLLKHTLTDILKLAFPRKAPGY